MLEVLLTLSHVLDASRWILLFRCGIRDEGHGQVLTIIVLERPCMSQYLL